MENANLLPVSPAPARTQNQQLRVIMNLPVRLVSPEGTMDVLPVDKKTKTQLRSPKLPINPCFWTNLNELIDFFKNCQKDDLLTRQEVTDYYMVDPSTISRWLSKGILKNYKVAIGLVLFKKSELPSLSDIYKL